MFSEQQEESYEIVVYISFSTVKSHAVNMVGTCYDHFPILNDVHVLDSLNLITFTDIKDIQRL